MRSAVEEKDGQTREMGKSFSCFLNVRQSGRLHNPPVLLVGSLLHFLSKIINFPPPVQFVIIHIYVYLLLLSRGLIENLIFRCRRAF